MAAETMTHFVSCKSYTDDPDIQYEIVSKICSRLKIREMKLEEAGLDSHPGSHAPEVICWAM